MKRLVIYISLLFFSIDTGFSQSRINRAENSLNSSNSWTKTTKENKEDKDVDLEFLLTLGTYTLEGFLYVVYGSYYVVIGPSDEKENKTGEVFITNYPYNYSNKGNYTYNIEEDNSRFRTEIKSRYLFGNRSLKGVHLTSSMRFLKRLELEMDYNQLWENSVNFGQDELAIYNMLLKYHRIRFEKIDFWWGVGVSHIAGDVNRYGFTYNLGSELFFVKPLSLEVSFNQTFVNTETVNKFNALLNCHIKRFKVIGGYEHLKIGTENFRMMTFGAGVFF